MIETNDTRTGLVNRAAMVAITTAIHSEAIALCCSHLTFSAVHVDEPGDPFALAGARERW